MTSTVTRSQSSRAALWCGGMGESHHVHPKKSTANAWSYHDIMDQNLWGMFPAPCWIYATKSLSLSVYLSKQRLPMFCLL